MIHRPDKHRERTTERRCIHVVGVAAVIVAAAAVWQKEISSGGNSRVLSLSCVCTEYNMEQCWASLQHAKIEPTWDLAYQS